MATPKQQIPIFVRAEIDNLNLSLEAFRVYGHLARRAGMDNHAWPSYTRIGQECFRGSFPNAKSESLRRKAIRAVKELEQKGIIKVERRQGTNNSAYLNNHYYLVPLDKWPNATKKEGQRKVASGH